MMMARTQIRPRATRAAKGSAARRGALLYDVRRAAAPLQRRRRFSDAPSPRERRVRRPRPRAVCAVARARGFPSRRPRADVQTRAVPRRAHGMARPPRDALPDVRSRRRRRGAAAEADEPERRRRVQDTTLVRQRQTPHGLDDGDTGEEGTFYTLVPIRPRWRGERRSLRTLPVVSLRPSLAVNPRPRRLSTPTDAFQLHPDVRSYGTTRRFPRRRRRIRRTPRRRREEERREETTTRTRKKTERRRSTRRNHLCR